MRTDIQSASAGVVGDDTLGVPTARRDRALSTVGAFLMMMTLTFTYVYGFLIVPGTERFGVSTAQFLLWITIFMISIGTANLVAGPLTTRLGVRPVAIVGSLGSAAALAGMAIAPNIGLFYVLAALFGIFYSGCSIMMAQTIVVGWHQNSRRKGLVVGVIAMAGGIAGFVYGVVFPPIITSLGFTGTMLTLAGLMLLLAGVPALFLIRTPPLTKKSPDAAADPDARAEPPLAPGVAWTIGLLALASFIFALENAFAGVQAAVYATRGFEPAAVGMLISFYAIGSLIAKPLLGYLNDRLGYGRTLIVIAVLFMLGLPGLALLSGAFPWTVWVLIPVAAVSVSIVLVQIPLLASRVVSPRRFATIYGYSVSVTWYGIALATPLWGLTFDLTGSYDLALYLGGALGVVGTLLCAVVVRRSNNQAAVAAQSQKAAAAAPASV